MAASFQKNRPHSPKNGPRGFLGTLISNLTSTKKNKMADPRWRKFFRKIGPIHLRLGLGVFLRWLISNQTSIYEKTKWRTQNVHNFFEKSVLVTSNCALGGNISILPINVVAHKCTYKSQTAHFCAVIFFILHIELSNFYKY